MAKEKKKEELLEELRLLRQRIKAYESMEGERRRVEKALRESEELLRDLVDKAGIAISIEDTDGNIVFANENNAKLHGYSLEEMKKLTIKDMIHPEDYEMVMENHRKNLEGKGKQRYELRSIKKDGSIVYFEVDTSPLSEGGQIVGTRTYLWDITERKKAEELLRQSEGKFRSITENLNVGIFRSSVGPEGKFIEVNPAMISIFGYHNKEELLEIGISDLYVNPKARETFNRKMLRDGFIKDEVSLSKRKDGTTFLASDTAVAVKNEKGDIVYYDGIVEDITERKKMEQELLKRKKIESIGILAGGIAHDFNNLLAVILGNISMVKSEFYPEHDHFRPLDNAENATVQAGYLAKKLITFSRGGWLNKKKLTLLKIINRAKEQINGANDVIFEVDIPAGTFHIDADEDQLIQVFSNLLQNAADWMREDKRIFIRAANITINENDDLPLRQGNYVKIAIMDKGTGIPKEDIEKIFDPYFSAKRLGTRKGMGLGLTICHSIIEKHGGHIVIESTHHTGTTAYIYLPVFPGKAGSIQKKEHRQGEKTVRILLMDDETSILDLVNQILQKMDYRVETARDGSEAIRLYKKAIQEDRSFDLVILDIVIKKGLGGKETLHRLQKIDPGVRAVALSGYVGDRDIDDLKEIGFREVIRKPARVKDFEYAINSVLAVKSPGIGE